ncbi:MAG: metallophosphoesterase [Saprospiraceae bacterium]|nr:metallophosphoesterase [Saprospiraceae bacterium]
MIRLVSYILSSIFLLYSCSKQDTGYSFFVAGHTYGSPLDTLPGLHPPFVHDFDYLHTLPKMKFGVLTGDMVYHSRSKYWDIVDKELSTLSIPIYFVAGNHDEGNGSLYQSRYGRTYYTFNYLNDLFLVLNPGLAGWNIQDDQLLFLKGQLEDAQKYRHIFIFFHQVLWQSIDRYADLRINSKDGKAPSINFWTEIEPLLKKLENQIFLFAGDVGATPDKTSFFYDRYDNITFVASGMGNLIQDNYVIVDVSQDGKVDIKIRWIGTSITQSVKTLEK